MSTTAEHADAWARAYDETAARVYGVVLSVVRDPARAEGITAEVYREAWSLAASDGQRAATITRLVTLAHRAAVKRVRSEDTHDKHDRSHCERNRCAGPGDDTLAALPEVERYAVGLAYFGGHSCHELADVMGIPLERVRGRLREGLIRLAPTTFSGIAGPGDTMAP